MFQVISNRVVSIIILYMCLIKKRAVNKKCSCILLFGYLHIALYAYILLIGAFFRAPILLFAHINQIPGRICKKTRLQLPAAILSVWVLDAFTNCMRCASWRAFTYVCFLHLSVWKYKAIIGIDDIEISAKSFFILMPRNNNWNLCSKWNCKNRYGMFNVT